MYLLMDCGNYQRSIATFRERITVVRDGCIYDRGSKKDRSHFRCIIDNFDCRVLPLFLSPMPRKRSNEKSLRGPEARGGT